MLSPSQDPTLHLVTGSPICDISQAFLVVDDLDHFEESGIFRPSFNLRLPGVSLIVRLVTGFAEEDPEAKCHSHHII